MSEETKTRDPDPKYWIENDGLLRDEGVLFGLAGLEEGAEHKTSAIRKYFNEKVAAVRQERERLDHREEELESKKEEVKRRIESLEDVSRNLNEDGEEAHGPHRQDAQGDGHVLTRYLLGLVFAAAVCVGNFYLVYELLSPHFEQSLLISLGVYCAGLFSVFTPRSIFYASSESQEKEERSPELWKTWLVETGMPISASIFVVVWTYPKLEIVRSIGVFLFLSALFLLSGKLLLSILPRLLGDIRRARSNLTAWWKRRRDKREAEKLRSNKMEKLEERLEDVRESRDQLEGVDKIESRREAAVELFVSEFELAREAVNQNALTTEEAAEIAQSSDVERDTSTI